MKVLIISAAVGKSPSEIVYSFVFDEIVRLAKRGIEVHVARLRFEGSGYYHGIYFHDIKRKAEPKVLYEAFRKLRYFPIYSLLRNPKKIYSELLYSLNIEKVAQKVNPDIIHAHFAYPEGWATLLAKFVLQQKIPFVLTLHGYDILVEPSIGYGIRLERRYELIIERVLKCADALIVASKAIYEETRKIVGSSEKLHVVPNGVDIQRFNPSVNGRRIRKQYSAEDKFIVFTLRHHRPIYGIDYLILAAKFILSRRKDVIFIIGGEGPLRQHYLGIVKQLGIKDSVLFPGTIPREEVPFYYAASDIVVIPSLQEGWGLVATEAMACGKPVIATNVGGLPDQVIDGYNGFLVPPRNPRAIAEKVLYLLENPSEIKRMGLNGRKLAEERFNIERRIDRIVELYRKLVER
jgi:N-acetyl-alpha-D-glucosaminyl L-malate synthase BshA